MKMRAGVRTDVGRLRERNEDAYLIRGPLVAVADGMGGHRGGDVASSLALEVLQTSGDSAPEADGEDFAALVEEIKEANRKVLERGESDAALRGMGTTLTAVLAETERAHVAHVGDSRAYLLRDGTLQQLTEDHTLVQRLVREGRLRPDEAESHPQRSVLTRALGVDDDLDIDQLTLDIHPGDRLLLCTDGLTTMVSKGRLQQILESEPDPQGACDLLVEEANRAGGDDNITAIVLDFEDEPSGGKGSGDETIAVAPVAPDGDSGDAGRGSASGATRIQTHPGPGEESPPAPRRRWRRVALWASLAIVVAVGALAGLRLYVDRQWYVGDYRGRVTIYNGIPTEVLGLDLSHVQQTTDLSTSEAVRLAPWRGLTDGITTNSLSDAEAIVEQIRQDVQEQPRPSPSPAPSPSLSPSGG